MKLLGQFFALDCLSVSRKKGLRRGVAWKHKYKNHKYFKEELYLSVTGIYLLFDCLFSSRWTERGKGSKGEEFQVSVDVRSA